MLQFGRYLRIGMAFGLCAVTPTVAVAGDLKAPTIAASIAAGADWASTYHALKYYKVREVNPLLRPLEREPAKMVVLGAAMDVGLVAAWNASVGKKHEKIAVAGLWTMTAFRAYLAIHNRRNEMKSARR
jgi:hypothetical protein